MKKGDGLWAAVFIIALHKVIQELGQRGTIFNKLSQICAYADDVVLITKTKRKLTQTPGDRSQENWIASKWKEI